MTTTITEPITIPRVPITAREQHPELPEPPGPNATDEQVEEYIQELCKQNPYM
jgi:hypothetical protein